MKLKTIWTMPAMGIQERLFRTRDWGAMAIADKLPLRIRFWVAMQMLGKATMSSPNVPATPLDVVLKNLDRPKVVR